MQPFNDNTTVCQWNGLSSEGEAESQNLALGWGLGREAGVPSPRSFTALKFYLLRGPQLFQQ